MSGHPDANCHQGWTRFLLCWMAGLPEMVVMFTTVLAHLIEITLYGLTIFLLVKFLGVGNVHETTSQS